jgi:hypothetical protein
MVSKRILGFYAFVDLWLLAAAALSIAMSFVWRAPNLMINFTLSDMDLTGASPPHFSPPYTLTIHHHPPLHVDTAGLVLGIFLLVTFFISVFAVLQKNHVTIGLVILNWALIADAIIVIVVGSILWFYSLRQRQNYFEVFKAVAPQTRLAIQDKVCLLLRALQGLPEHNKLFFGHLRVSSLITIVPMLRLLCIQRHNAGDLGRLLLGP